MHPNRSSSTVNDIDICAPRASWEYFFYSYNPGGERNERSWIGGFSFFLYIGLIIDRWREIRRDRETGSDETALKKESTVSKIEYVGKIMPRSDGSFVLSLSYTGCSIKYDSVWEKNKSGIKVFQRLCFRKEFSAKLELELVIIYRLIRYELSILCNFYAKWNISKK